jgi:membrane fusion protein, multidrug efflux system
MMMKLNKLLVILVTTAFLTSCGGSNGRVEEIKEEIKTKKKEIAALSQEITDLESELFDLDPTTVDSANFIKVGVKEIVPETFTKNLVINGHVEAVKQVNLVAEIPGVIQSIYVEEGQRVYQGQSLFTINTTTLYSQLQELKTRLEFAETAYQKQEELWNQEIGSEMQYLQAKNNKESVEQSIRTLQTQLYKTTVTAKFSGVVDRIYFKEGDMPQGVVMVLVNLNEMKVLADVSESYLSGINAGDSVKIHFPAYDESIDATISRTGNIVNPDNRSFVIESRIKNEDKKLKPNIIAEIELKEYENDKALIIPSKIVKQDLDGNYFVFVIEKNARGNNVAIKREITFDHVSDGKTMITSGIKKGDLVVVKGYDRISSGTEVMIKNN